jgi:AraC-like DNA-binding protein
MVGYNSVDYFHGKFKKYVMMTPKKYQMTYKDSH